MMRWPARSAWGVTRVLVVIWLLGPEGGARSDLYYYKDSLSSLSLNGIHDTLGEYPIPAFVLLAAPYAVLKLVHATAAYPAAIVLCAACADFAFLWFLHRSRKWQQQPVRLGASAAEWAWIVAIPALGATAYARFDLIPGILVAMALLYAVHRPNVAAAFSALATGVKYWPAMVLPTLGAPRDSRRTVVRAITVTGLVLGLLSLAVGGWSRIVSPLQYQGDRGLQIESIFATPAMISWARGPDAYLIWVSPAKAWEIDGPHVALLLHASVITTAILAVALIAMWVMAWARMRRILDSIDAMVWMTLASVSGFLLTSKVFSPQYLLWLLPSAAAGLVVLRGHRTWSRLSIWTAALMATSVITQVIFPLNYNDLTGHNDGSSTMVSLLAVRNLFVVALCGFAFYESFRLLLARAPEVERASAGLSTRVEA